MLIASSHSGSFEVKKKIPLRVGVNILLFLSVTLLNEAHMVQKQQNGQGVLETSLKNKKDGGRNAENLISGYQRRFLEIFFALATPHGFRSNSKENKKPSFYHNPWFKRLWWF